MFSFQIRLDFIHTYERMKGVSEEWQRVIRGRLDENNVHTVRATAASPKLIIYIYGVNILHGVGCNFYKPW